MTITEALTTVRYVTDSNGQRTDVLIPFASWKTILAAWKKLMEEAEDREDSAILQEWLEKRAAQRVEMITLDTLEQELVADGLLPG